MFGVCGSQIIESRLYSSSKYLSQYNQCDESSHSRVQWVDSSVPLANAENPVTSAWIFCLLRTLLSPHRLSLLLTVTGETVKVTGGNHIVQRRRMQGTRVDHVWKNLRHELNLLFPGPMEHLPCIEKNRNSLLCLRKTISAQASCFGS